MKNQSNLVVLPPINQPQYKSELVDRLREVAAERFAVMQADRKETPTLVIPKNLTTFIGTKLFMDYLVAVHEYLVRFNVLQKKYENIQKKLQNRVTMQHELLQSQRHDLVQYEKTITVNYGIIILKFSSKNNKEDQFFFETLIYLTGKIMKSFFSRQDYFLLEEELDRLFRSDKYNIVKKRHENDQILRKWPVLKNNTRGPTAKINMSIILSQAEQKSQALKEAVKMRKKQKEERRTISSYDVEVEDLDVRSPIMSAYLPSNRVRMVAFSKQRKLKVYPSPDGRANPAANQKIQSLQKISHVG